MGCWNNTCGLTNLPIVVGDPVYVFPIIEKDISGYRSHCETTAFYEPMLTPFTAVYNDYGAGEDCEGAILEPFVDMMKSSLVELSLTEDSASDEPIDRESFDIDAFFEAVHDDKLFVRGYPRKAAVYFTMIRKDIVDRLWTEWKFDVYVGEGNATDPKDAYERGVTHAMLSERFIPLFVESLKTIAETTEGLPKIEREIQRRIAMRRNDDFTVLRSLLYTFDSSNYWDPLYIKDQLMDLVVAGEYDRATELMRLQLLGVMVNEMMTSTRRVWMPVMHQGSQSQEYDDYRLLHKLANDVMDERDARYRAEWGDDEDDEVAA